MGRLVRTRLRMAGRTPAFVYRPVISRLTMAVVVLVPASVVGLWLLPLVLHSALCAGASTVALVVLAYRCTSMSLAFDSDQVTIRNVFRTTTVRWTDVGRVTAGSPLLAARDDQCLRFDLYRGRVVHATATMWAGRHGPDLLRHLSEYRSEPLDLEFLVRPRWWAGGSTALRTKHPSPVILGRGEHPERAARDADAPHDRTGPPVPRRTKVLAVGTALLLPLGTGFLVFGSGKGLGFWLSFGAVLVGATSYVWVFRPVRKPPAATDDHVER
ncbi:MAG: hypothetical protein QOD72_2312 [Acidimicrobiaceae bacterium]|nr:hypothetical protein [Acidimicrobiaceae bacterium]